MHIDSLLLIHGAGSGPWIFDTWRDAFPDIDVFAVDLHEGVGSQPSMRDYARVLEGAASSVAGTKACCGWSMGGLVAMMRQELFEALVLLEPSAPAEIQGYHQVAAAAGEFDPEDAYGPFPTGIRSRPESSPARAERKSGISVPTLTCPTLVIFGDEFAEERGRPVAHVYRAQMLEFPGFSHWDLVLRPEVREAIRDWLNNL
jgi:pimeloyl-ACP methyl ester carboxylesterase